MDVIEIETLQKPFKVKRGLGLDVFFQDLTYFFLRERGGVESFSAT